MDIAVDVVKKKDFWRTRDSFLNTKTKTAALQRSLLFFQPSDPIRFRWPDLATCIFGTTQLVVTCVPLSSITRYTPSGIQAPQSRKPRMTSKARTCAES